MKYFRLPSINIVENVQLYICQYCRRRAFPWFAKNFYVDITISTFDVVLQTFRRDVKSYASSLPETKGYVWACTQTEICIHECAHIKMQCSAIHLDTKSKTDFKKGEISPRRSVLQSVLCWKETPWKNVMSKLVSMWSQLKLRCVRLFLETKKVFCRPLPHWGSVSSFVGKTNQWNTSTSLPTSHWASAVAAQGWR